MDDKQKKGEELNQRSRFLFDSAASNWYTSSFISAGVGIASGLLSYFKFEEVVAYIFAFIGVGLSLYAYYLRLRFASKYDMAETMRRQSVLTEGLGYSIDATQFDVWKVRAGKQIDKRFKLEPRDANYYASKSVPGPRRLLEMLQESAFYTRNLYMRLRTLLIVVLAPIVILSLAVLVILSALSATKPFSLGLANAVLLILPIVVAADLLGSILKLTRMIDGIIQIETDVNRILKSSRITESTALRQVFEYNCYTASGFPIHNYLFKKWQKAIEEAWDAR